MIPSLVRIQSGEQKKAPGESVNHLGLSCVWVWAARTGGGDAPLRDSACSLDLLEE